MQWMNNPKNTCVFVASSLYETRLHRIMVVVFIKANIQFKMMNTTTCTMIHCRHISL